MYSRVTIVFLILGSLFFLLGQAEGQEPDHRDPSVTNDDESSWSHERGRHSELRTPPESELGEGRSTAMQVMNLEHRIDDMLTRALDHFFEPGAYLLDVQIEVSPRAYHRERSVPVMREELPQPRADLPGLPFVPPDMMRDTQAERVQTDEERTETDTFHVPDIDRFHITIWADSLLAEQQLDLMREVVHSKLYIDPDHGDRLEVLRRSFRDEEDAGPAAAAADTDRYFLLLLGGVILLGLMLILLVWYLMIFLPRQRQPERFPATYQSRKPEGSAEGDASGGQPAGLPPASGQNAAEHPHGEDEWEDPSAVRIYLMEVILSNPEQIGRLFTYWYESEGENGSRRAAAILQNTDSKLLTVLRSTIAPPALESIRESMEVPPSQLSTKKDLLLRQFARQLRLRQQQAGGPDDFTVLSTFDFLHHLNDTHLLALLRREKERVIALVISHLSDDRKSRILQHFGLEQAGRILFCLSQVRNVSFREYEKIAVRLFDKSYHDTRRELQVSERDVEQLVSIIEHIPASEQEKYIKQLDTMVSELADAVRDRVITMDRIPELEDDLLEKTVDSMNRSELAAALVGTGEELRTRLLQFRPQKEEKLIREEIEKMVYLSREQIDEARGRLLQLLRDFRKKEQKTHTHLSRTSFVLD